MAARVSVIVTSTGRADALRGGLHALPGQGVDDLEVIVVNDGGPDVSAVVEGAPGACRARLINLPAPGGRAAARNVGIGVATGRYLAFPDEGAVYLPGHLGHLVGLMNQTGAEVAYAACAVVSGPVDLSSSAAATGTAVGEADAAEDRAAVLRGIGAAHDVSHPFDGLMLAVADYIPTSAVVCRNLDLSGSAGIRFDDRLSVLEDWELWLRLHQRHRRRFVHSPRIGVVHQDLHASDGPTALQDGPCGGGGPLADYPAAHAWVSARYPAVPGSRVARYRRYAADLYGNAAARSARGEALPEFAHDHAIRALYDGFTGRMAEDAVPVLLGSAISR